MFILDLAALWVIFTAVLSGLMSRTWAIGTLFSSSWSVLLSCVPHFYEDIWTRYRSFQCLGGNKLSTVKRRNGCGRKSPGTMARAQILRLNQTGIGSWALPLTGLWSWAVCFLPWRAGIIECIICGLSWQSTADWVDDTTKIYFLTDQEARSPRYWILVGSVSSKASLYLACRWLSSPCLFMAFPLCISVS